MPARLAPLLALLFAAPAWSAWTLVTEAGPGAVYADPATLARNGDMVRMAWLLDYRNFQRMVEVGYWSKQAVSEFDCAQRRTRNLSVSLRAEHMGQGPSHYADDTVREWEAVEPDGVTGKLWQAACGK